MSFVVPQIKLTWQVCWFFYVAFQYSAPHLPGWPFPHNYSFFKLAWVPTLFPEKKITMYTNKQQVPTGVLIILNTQNLVGAELREAKTDVLGSKEMREQNHDPPNSVEINIGQV